MIGMVIACNPDARQVDLLPNDLFLLEARDWWLTPGTALRVLQVQTLPIKDRRPRRPWMFLTVEVVDAGSLTTQILPRFRLSANDAGTWLRSRS